MLIGQKQIQANLDKLIKSRQSSHFPHVLLSGPAGFGKTSFAKYIAEKLNRNIIQVNGSTVSGIKDIAKCIFSVKENDILFIDEVHRLNIKSQECLYPAIENFVFNIFQDNSQEPISIELPKFTLVSATTHLGKLSDPFISRFEHVFEMIEYSNAEIAEIIK